MTASLDASATGEILNFDPTWSPDSQSIAFDSTNAEDKSIYIGNINAALPQKIIFSTGNDLMPDWK